MTHTSMYYSMKYYLTILHVAHIFSISYTRLLQDRYHILSLIATYLNCEQAQNPQEHHNNR